MHTGTDVPPPKSIFDLYHHHLENVNHFPGEPVARYLARPQPDTHDETIDVDFFLMLAEFLLRMPVALIGLFCLATMMSLHYAGRAITTRYQASAPQHPTMPGISTLSQSLFSNHSEPSVPSAEKDNQDPCITTSFAKG